MNQLHDRLVNARENLSLWWSEITFTSPQRRSLLAIAAIVVATSAFFVIRGNSAAVIEAPPALAVEVTTVEITVDVAGGVTNPGVYSLPMNSRVFDAIKAAGNIVKGADTSDINLARILKDGEQVYIYPPQKSGSISSPRTYRAPPKARSTKPSGPIAINRATAKELETLDGIGPVLAERIIAYRNINGPFLDIADLLKVSGIGAAKFAGLKEKIRI
jgi:competence protein ComEA